MKIIAQAGRNKFHIEATDDEIARLMGHASQSSMERDRRDRLEVGTIINVDAGWQYVQWIYHHRERFERMANNMRKAADTISEFPALFERLSIPEADDLRKQRRTGS